VIALREVRRLREELGGFLPTAPRFSADDRELARQLLGNVDDITVEAFLRESWRLAEQSSKVAGVSARKLLHAGIVKNFLADPEGGKPRRKRMTKPKPDPDIIVTYAFPGRSDPPVLYKGRNPVTWPECYEACALHGVGTFAAKRDKEHRQIVVAPDGVVSMLDHDGGTYRQVGTVSEMEVDDEEENQSV
jgi:hypothetical protein